MIETRLLAVDERPCLVPLISELLTHYRLPVPPPAELAAVLLAQPAGVEFLVAGNGGAMAGVAAFTQMFPAAGAAGQLYLKDLFVAEPSRGIGVGTVMMRRLAALALERGCARLDWTTERWNERAVAFYRRLGAREETAKVYFRAEGGTLRALAAP